MELLFSTIVLKYDYNDSGENTSQCLVDKFILQGLEWKDKGHLNFALLELNNAKLLSQWLNVGLSDDYYDLYQQVIGGLVSSYLKIGNMAIGTNKTEFALTYIEKGIDLLQANYEAFQNAKTIERSFNEILQLNNEISVKLSNIALFEDAFMINKLNRNLCNGKIDTTCYIADTTQLFIIKSYLDNGINIIYDLIEKGQFPDAVSYYYEIVDTASLVFEQITELEDITDLAVFISDTLFFQSQTLLNASQSAIALDKLLLSKDILFKAGLNSEVINNKLQTVAEEAILEILSNARFSIWKNEIAVANSQIKRARELNTAYLDNKSKRVNEKFLEIENYRESRVCVDIVNSYNDAIKKLTLLIRDSKYNEITKLINEAESYIQDFKGCDIDESLLSSMRLRNSVLFTYLDLYDNIKSDLFIHNYNEVILTYIKLEDYYDENYKSLNGISFNNIENFLTAQGLNSLTLAAVNYFMDNDDYDQALKYLKLSMDQGLDQNSNKEIIKNIADHLAKRDRENDISVNTALDQYTEGMYNKSFFRLAYIRARYFKNN